MKKLFKRLLVLSLVISSLLIMAGCGKQAEVISYDDAALRSSVKSTIGVMAAIDPTVYEKLRAQYEAADMEESLKYMGILADGDAFFAGTESFIDAKEELGNVDLSVLKDEDITVTADADEILVNVRVTGDMTDNYGEIRTADIEMVYSPKLKLVSSVTNIHRSFRENMSNAGMNTLLGMGTVFAVLIFIALVIHCFKYISLIEKKLQEKKNAPREKAEAIDNAVATIIENEERTDDLELIAVISAAIAAYEGQEAPVTGDGYVVRSIKRVR